MNSSPLKSAEDSINNLKHNIKICNGTETSLSAASSFGNFVAAYYEKEINGDEMTQMMDDVRRLLSSFNKKCKCQLK